MATKKKLDAKHGKSTNSGKVSPRSDERAKPLTTSQANKVKSIAKRDKAVSSIEKGAKKTAESTKSNAKWFDSAARETAKTVNKVRRTGKAKSITGYDGEKIYSWDGTKRDYRDNVEMYALGCGMTVKSAEKAAKKAANKYIKGKNNHKGRNK